MKLSLIAQAADGDVRRALTAVVAGLWPALRGTREVSAPERSAHTGS